MKGGKVRLCYAYNPPEDLSVDDKIRYEQVLNEKLNSIRAYTWLLEKTMKSLSDAESALSIQYDPEGRFGV